LVVFAAIASPPGTEIVTSTGRSVTSLSAARIMRSGTGLIAGAPTGNPRPGFVIVPTPGPARRRVAHSPGAGHSTAAVTRAPSVQSGSSPASFTTTHRAGASLSTGKRTRRPEGRPTSTVSGAEPVTSPTAAAFATAVAQVPVVHPARSPVVRAATSGAR